MRANRIIFSMAMAIAALLALASPVAAKPGKVKTATAAASTSVDDQVVVLTATCPKGTKVVGGGYSTATASAGASVTDFHQVFTSRRAGGKGWTVSAFRLDGAPAGPALAVSAEAYCRSDPGKVTERSATESSIGPPATNAFSPEAPCPYKKSVVAGGFSFANTSFATQNYFHSATRPVGKVGWTSIAVATSAGPSATAFAYCQTGKPRPQRGATVALPPSNGTVASADTAPCPGKRSALGGGFANPAVFAGVGFLLVTESRRLDKSWRVSGFNPSGTATGSFSSIALCG